MNALERRILQKFKGEPSREVGTSEVIREVLPDECQGMREILLGSRERAQLLVARRKRGQLHRRVLYHLNKLVGQGEILQTRVQGRGEKLFVLNLQRKEAETQPPYPDLDPRPVTPIEGYEKEGLVQKWDGEAWVERVNAIVMDAAQFSGIFKLQAVISDFFLRVNDSIGVYRFEEIIEHGDKDAWVEGLRRLDLEAKDFNREVSLMINLKQLHQGGRLLDFVTRFVGLRPGRVSLIWEVDGAALDQREDEVRFFIAQLSAHRIPIFFRNERLAEAPCFWGRAGAFSLDPTEWGLFTKANPPLKIGLCSLCSISVNMGRFFQKGRAFQEFRGLIRKAAKALFLAHGALRDRARGQFAMLNRLNEDSKVFYQMGSNQIRMENFPHKGTEGDHARALLESCRVEVEQFVRLQETILKSCGMPLRFKIGLSMSGESSPLFLSRFNDFFKPEVQEYIRNKERLARLTKGRDCLKIVLSGEHGKEGVEAVRYLLDHVQVPFFSLSAEERGVVKLTSFLR